MKAIDRIYEYINYKGLKISDFERINSISNGYLTKMKMRSASIGEDILNKILENCRDINPTWLLTGKGDMLLDAKTNVETKEHITTPSDREFLLKRIEELAIENHDLRKEIEQLKNKPTTNVGPRSYSPHKEEINIAAEEGITKLK